MSLSDLAALGSFVSGLAVLVSLVFLYFQVRQVAAQVRQAERNQQASIRHSHISRSVDIHLAQADPGLAEVWARGAWSPHEITQTELRQFFSLCRGRFQHAEDGFYQHEEGLLDENAFATWTAGVRGVLKVPGVRLAWKRMRRTHAGRFRDFMDEHVALSALEPSTDDSSLDAWRADFAAETASEPR
jgi:hypothetical protein